MTLSFEVNGVAVPAEAVLIVGSTIGGVQGLPSSAWYGEPSTATIIVDDPNSDYDFRAWEVFTADESAATGKTRVFTGWIFDIRLSRGPLPYRNETGRVWELDIIDQNACLSFEVFRANSAQRPDETDLERIEFILESAPMAGTPVVAGDRTNLTDNPANLQSADYVRQYPVEAFTATAGQSGKTFYVFWNQDEERLELYYDQITAYPAAAASISNLMADEGAGVFYPMLDGQLRRAGDSIYTGELLDFVGGAVYQRNATTIDRLSPTPLSPINFLRDFMRRSDQIGLVSTANAIVTEDLAQHATEEDTITVTVRVPAANVNDIEAGQRVTVTFSHLVGYETPTDVNVIRRNVVPTEGRVDMYDIYYELSNKAKLRDLDGGDPDDLPHQDDCDFEGIAAVQAGTSSVVGGAPGTITIADAGTPGNTILLWACHREKTTTLTIDGFTDITGNIDALADGHQTWRAHMFYRNVEAGDTAVLDCTVGGTSAGIGVAYAELPGILTPDSFDTESIGPGGGSPAPFNAGTVTATGSSSLLVAGISGRNNVGVATSTTWDAPAEELADASPGTLPQTAMAIKVVDAGSQTMEGDFTFAGLLRGWVSAVIAFSCPEGTCPATGQWVEDETVTLTGADGTTRCPFADGSLHVFIDNVEQTATLVSQDGATGDFTLGFDPTPTEVCTVMYQGR